MPELPQSRKAWIGGGAAGAVLLIALGWFGVLGPEFASTTSTKSETADVQMQNAALSGKVSRLRAQDKQLPALVNQLAAVQQELPADSGMPAYITQLMRQAQAAGVRLTSIAAGVPTLVTAGAPGTAPTVVGDPAGHLFAIPVNVVGDGSLAHQRSLLAAIQTVGPRRSLVTSVSYAPTDSSSTSSSIDARTTMTVKLQVFVAPRSPADEAALKRQLAVKPG